MRVVLVVVLCFAALALASASSKVTPKGTVSHKTSGHDSVLIRPKHAKTVARTAIGPPSYPPSTLPAVRCSQFNLHAVPNDCWVPSWDGGYGLCFNLWHYNPLSLMDGSPQGPYFALDETQPCVWVVASGNFNCSVNVYQDPGNTLWIGTGTLGFRDFTVDLSADTYNLAGGYIDVTTKIDSTKVILADIVGNPYNFGNLSTSIYFEPMGMWPMPMDDLVPLANRIMQDPDKVALGDSSYYLNLWGSNGWNPSSMEYVGQTTGMDAQFRLECTGLDIAPSCPVCPAGDHVTAGVYLPSCVTPGKTVTQFSSGNCVSLGFGSSILQCPSS